jgi:O-antigen/teichoic acid export membrane protein
MMTLIRRGRRLTSVFASNAAGTILGQLVTLITIPAQLHYLGAEQFGLIVLFNSFVAAGALTDLGIGPTVLRFVARTERHPKALAHVFTSSITVILMLSVFVAMLGAIAAVVHVLLKGDVPIAGSLRSAELAALVVVTIGASMLSGLGLNVIKGLRLYRAYAIAESLQRILLPVAGTIVAVMTKDAGAVLLSTCVGFIVSACILLRWAGSLVKAPVGITTNLRYFKRRMFAFGQWVWVQALFGFLGAQADRFIVAATMSLSALAVYAVAMSVANAMIAALSAGGSFLLPEASSRLSDKAWLTQTFVRFTFLFSALSALSIIAFLPLAPTLLNLWVKADMATQVLPVLLPILWTVSSSAASVPGTQIMNAMGYTKFGAILGVVNNTVMLAAMLAAGSIYGLQGVIMAKLMAVPIGYAARAVTARHVFSLKKAPLVAFRMVWPTIAGALVVLPISWHFLT